MIIILQTNNAMDTPNATFGIKDVIALYESMSKPIIVNP